MQLLGTEHAERFEELKRDIEPRETKNFYFSKIDHLGAEATMRLNLLMSEMMTVGPFGPLFLRTTDRNYKPEINGIPLLNIFEGAPEYWTSGITLNAINLADSIILENEAACLQDVEAYKQFHDMHLTCITVKMAEHGDRGKAVSSISAVTNLHPIGYYSHPANNRIVEGLSGNLIPDRSIMSMGGQPLKLKGKLFDTMVQATMAMNDYHDDAIGRVELSNILLSYFEI